MVVVTEGTQFETLYLKTNADIAQRNITTFTLHSLRY